MGDHRLTHEDRETMKWVDAAALAALPAVPMAGKDFDSIAQEAYAIGLAMLRERMRLNDDLHELNVAALEKKVAEVDAANKKPSTV